jgi:phosphomannomutase
MLVQSLSGIRGIYGKSLTPDIASKYASSYFSIFRPKTIVIGRDTRPSGPAIKTAMINVLPCKVIDVGILPTPAIQNAVRHFKADGGIIITASHNPAEWNGFKFLRKDGSVLHEDEMAKVIASYEKTALRPPALSKKTIAVQKRAEALEAYTKFVLNTISKKALDTIKRQNIVILIDPNGGAGVVAKDILEKADMEVIVVNMEPGRFEREIEPTRESLAYLLPKLKRAKASFAAGFDCDADRVEILLPNGNILSGNEMLALAAQRIFSQAKNPKKETVVVNNATSSMVKEVVEAFGAKYVEVEVGEANVIHAMKKEKATLGGEGSSSGIILAPATSRDGILGVLMMAALGGRLSSLLENLPESCYLKEKITIEPSKIPYAKQMFYGFYHSKTPDVDFRKGGAVKAWLSKRSFVWCRDSKTEEGILRVIVDAPTKKEATFLMQEALSVIKEAL